MPNARNPNAWLGAFALVLIALLVWGLEQVTLAPLETGEVYPAYSSLRSDPQGARALYESLGQLPGVTVERLYKPRTKLAGEADAIFVLGVDPAGWSVLKDQTLEDYEKLVADGGRLVIGFLPARSEFRSDPGKPPAIEPRWHLKMVVHNPPRISSSKMPRHSALSFEPGPEWRILAQRDGLASAVERDFGAGSVALTAESYPLSNEGLREARDAGLIASLAGPARHIIFDENHFGVIETGSVTKLMRQYKLEGAVAVLILVAALFLWRSASSFLPPRTVSVSGAVAGRDSLEGLSALLRRGVPEKALFEVCVAEWAKSSRDADPSRFEQIAREGSADPVNAYRAACHILEKK
jgi:Domain of unknown function (DUF4350)